MKKKLILLILPVLLLCLLTGCGYEIRYDCRGLPEGAKVYLLVKDNDDSYAHNTPKGTELEKYCVDGWHCRSSIVVNTEMRKKSIEENPAIRIAVLDEDGKLLKISPEFSLRIKGKYYYWDDFSYDYETNEVTGKHSEYYSDDETAIEFVNLLVAAADIVCFIIYMIAICRLNKRDYGDYYIFLFLNIPNLLIIIMGGLWTFCGYFQAPDKPSNFDRNIKGYLLFIALVCLMNGFGFIRYRRMKRLAESQKEAEKNNGLPQ